jgi:hypothetical protein
VRSNTSCLLLVEGLAPKKTPLATNACHVLSWWSLLCLHSGEWTTSFCPVQTSCVASLYCQENGVPADAAASTATHTASEGLKKVPELGLGPATKHSMRQTCDEKVESRMIQP